MSIRIFKHMQRRYALALVRHGQLRIGTLHDFKNIEHVRGIADCTEGVKRIDVSIDSQSYVSGKDVPKTLAALGIISTDDSSSNISLENIYVSKTFEAPNCYLWCASTLGTREVMAQFNGADTCVEVTQPERFFAILNQAMFVFDTEYRGIAQVKYQPRVEPWNAMDLGAHPAITKGLEFARQHEVRAIWVPTNSGDIGPILLQVEGLSQCCEIRDI